MKRFNIFQLIFMAAVLVYSIAGIFLAVYDLFQPAFGPK